MNPYIFCLSFFFIGLGGAFSIHYPWLRMGSPPGAGLMMQGILIVLMISIAALSEFLALPRLSDRAIRLFMVFMGLGNALGLMMALI